MDPGGAWLFLSPFGRGAHARPETRRMRRVFPSAHAPTAGPCMHGPGPARMRAGRLQLLRSHAGEPSYRRLASRLGDQNVGA